MPSWRWGVLMAAETDARIRRTTANLRQRLCEARNEAGIWRGELSTSALSTAVAAMALHQIGPEANREKVARALAWLAANANADGGWGDTTRSPSNLSTTLLCWSCLALAEGRDAGATLAARNARQWIEARSGSCDPRAIARAVLAAYGDDRTFSAPILTVCALMGRLGAAPWSLVPQLPFEYALLPAPWYRRVRMSVVSYALPALIAIGLVRHRAAARRWSWRARLRDRVTGAALRVLHRCQPDHGGFLEAAPLTGFVGLSLAAAGLGDHPVAKACERFLVTHVREDGSWPIDTDLATWVTTLAIKALDASPAGVAACGPRMAGEVRGWLLAQQHRRVHPFTQAKPGGWGWSELPGAVPDADDTSGALLGLKALGDAGGDVRDAVTGGVTWLMELQNGDGGIPTFCRGWGRLPFDRSCPDITAHALQAFAAWQPCLEPLMQRRVEQAMHRAVRYLQRTQTPEGAWVPLWFGNQSAPGQANPTYGTAQVLWSLQRLGPVAGSVTAGMSDRAARWLAAAQNPDGGWGGDRGMPSTIEETSLAVGALARLGVSEPVRNGALWLCHATREGMQTEAAPIGLYFARLWYAESLYPLVFAAQAFGAVESTRLAHTDAAIDCAGRL